MRMNSTQHNLNIRKKENNYKQNDILYICLQSEIHLPIEFYSAIFRPVELYIASFVWK